MRLSEACLQVSDVGALVHWVDLCGDGFAGGGPALSRAPAGWDGGPCLVEEFAKGVGCFFLLAESVVEPAAGAPEVVHHLLQCRLRPRLRWRICYVRGSEAWVREVEAVEGEEDVVGCYVKAAPAVA